MAHLHCGNPVPRSAVGRRTSVGVYLGDVILIVQWYFYQSPSSTSCCEMQPSGCTFCIAPVTLLHENFASEIFVDVRLTFLKIISVHGCSGLQSNVPTTSLEPSANAHTNSESIQEMFFHDKTTVLKAHRLRLHPCNGIWILKKLLTRQTFSL